MKQRIKKTDIIKRKASFNPPTIPEEMWCDFRQDYEAGRSLKEIAEKYFCDPRTVRRCIMVNKSSSDLGRQTEPTKLAPYIGQIEILFQEYLADSAKSTRDSTAISGTSGICRISKEITVHLQTLGYTGCERTVRNYLRNRYQYVRYSR